MTAFTHGEEALENEAYDVLPSGYGVLIACLASLRVAVTPKR